MSVALRTYYRGAGLVAMRDHVNGVTRNYKCDHQGTVQCLTDNQGAVTDRFACDAWGVEVKREGTSLNRQWYVGNLGYYRQVDQALDYVRQRWLVAAAGVWLSRDPMSFVIGAASSPRRSFTPFGPSPAPGYSHGKTGAYDIQDLAAADDAAEQGGMPTTTAYRTYVAANPALWIDPSGLFAQVRQTCWILGVLGRNQRPYVGRNYLVERVIKAVTAGRPNSAARIFPSSYGLPPLNLDTLTHHDNIWWWISGQLRHDRCPCWCVVAYSRGGGQAEKMATKVLKELGDKDLRAVITVEAMQVTPAKRDTTRVPVTRKLAGAKYHQHWVAEKPVVVKGERIEDPGVENHGPIAGTNHITIQGWIALNHLHYLVQSLQERCFR